MIPSCGHYVQKHVKSAKVKLKFKVCMKLNEIFSQGAFNDIFVDASILDPLSPEQKCCMNNKVPSKCLEMCVVSRDSDSRSLINEDSILKYCNPFWDIIGWCRGNEPGNFFGYFTHPVIVLVFIFCIHFGLSWSS